MSTLVKVCGLSTPDTLDAALAAGADWIGLVHFPPSPRHVDLARGASLAARARGRALVVLLLVDPDDATLALACEAVRPDLVQLHGTEPPERVAAIRARGRPVMKAVGIAEAADLANAIRYAPVADRLLLDARAPPGSRRPGGNGRAFDWRLLDALDRAGLDPALPFVLSGGLDANNVAAAVAATGAVAVDVSSGVERRPGEKDPDLIAAFVAAAKGSGPRPATLPADPFPPRGP